jgi:hypothetical protein
LSAHRADDSLSFFRAELNRVAPELNRPNFHSPLNTYVTDSRSGMIVRSKEYFAVLAEDLERRTEQNRIPFVVIHGKPTGNKGEMEISIVTGHSRWVPLPQESGASDGVEIGASAGPVVPGGTVISGTVYTWAANAGKPYRRKFVSLN